MQITVVKPSVELLTPPEMIRAQLEIVEKAGRTCYKSEGKIGDGTAEKFIKSIIGRGHESVIEHGNATVKFIGSRSMSHQLVRHRLCAFSQESQRYCDYGGKGLVVICPPRVFSITPGSYESRGDGEWADIRISAKGRAPFLDRCADAYNMYLCERECGTPAEDARCYLPNATKTEVVVTANWRQWRHMFKHRALNKAAQWEIRELMLAALRELAAILPCVFGDLLPGNEGGRDV